MFKTGINEYKRIKTSVANHLDRYTIIKTSLNQYKQRCVFLNRRSPVPFDRHSGQANPASPSSTSSARLHPDTALVHELDLALGKLFAILGVFHRFAVKVEALRVDGFLVKNYGKASCGHPSASGRRPDGDGPGAGRIGDSGIAGARTSKTTGMAGGANQNWRGDKK